MTTILTKLNKSNGKSTTAKIKYTHTHSGVWVDFYESGKLLRKLSGLITDDAAYNQYLFAIKDGYKVKAVY